MTATQYIKVPKFLIFIDKLKKNARLVFEYLIMKWDYLESKHKGAEEIYYNISQKKLAQDLNASLRSISNAVKQLKELGLVKVRQHSEVDCTLDYIRTDITKTEIFKSLDDDKKYLYEYLYEKESKSIEDATTMPCEAPQTPEVEEKSIDIDDDMVTLMGSTDYKFSQKQIQKLINIIKEKDSTLNPAEIITRVYRRMRDGGFKVKKWFSYLLKSVKTEIETTPVVEMCPQQAQSSTAQMCEKNQKGENMNSEYFEHINRKAQDIKERENKILSQEKSKKIEIDNQLVTSIQLKIMQDYFQCNMTRDEVKSLCIHIKKNLVQELHVLDDCDIFLYICQLCNRVIHNINYNNIKITKMIAYMISIVNNDIDEFIKKKETEETKFYEYEDKPSYNLDAYIENLHQNY